VDPDMFSPAVDCSDIRHKYRLDNTHVVLFSGHIEEWAGIGVLHDLVKGLERVPGRWVLLLVGTGSGVAPLLEKVHDDGLSHLLVAAGLQPFELMPKFNAVADISLCIFPDTLAGNAASPLKLFEYMASGCAVVATRVAGVAEVIDSETGCLVDPNDVEGLVENVIRLCSNTEERQRLARNARSLIESRYSWGHLADEFLSVCHRVFEDPHPAAQDRAIVA
ncbi:MAG: glycosyltransferase, partial [Candidatus Thorarchaeota archaeon]